MKRSSFFLFAFFSATVLVGIFAVSYSSLIAQTSTVDDQFACEPADGSSSGEFTGILLPSDITAKITDPLNAARTFVLTCYNKQYPEDKDLRGDSNPVTAKVMSGTLSCDTRQTTHNSVTLNYAYINGTDVRLLRDGVVVAPSLGSGSVPPNQKSFPDAGVLPSKTHTYTLQSKDSEAVYHTLAKADCTTTAEPLPDLTATTPTAALVPGTGVSTGKANTFYEGGTLRFKGAVRNQNDLPNPATAPASASRTGWRVFEGTNPPTPLPLESSVDTPLLAVGASAPVSRDIKGVRKGTYYFALCADEPKLISELREDNNCSGGKADAIPANALKIEVIPLKPASVQLFIGNSQKAVTGSYGSTHTLSWTSVHVLPGSCKPAAGSAPFVLPADPMKNINGTASVGPLTDAIHSYLIECRANLDAKGTDGVRGGVVKDIVPAVANINLPIVSCALAPDNPLLIRVGDTVKWIATPTPSPAPTGSYGYRFDTQTTFNVATIYTKSYTTAGQQPSFPVILRATAESGARDSLPGTCLGLKIEPKLPDLVGNKPEIECTGTGNINECYVGRATITGVVSNNGDADAPAGFTNQYRASPSGAPGSFSPFQDGAGKALSFLLSPDGVVSKQGGQRAVASHGWQAGPGIWYFDLCADYSPSQVDEGNKETNNCGVVAQKTFAPLTQLTAQSTLDGGVVPGAVITQRGTPGDMGGTTGSVDYPKKRAATIAEVKLEAPKTHAGGNFIAWGNCDLTEFVTGETEKKRLCIVSVAASGAKTITAQYGKVPSCDIKFNNSDGPITILNSTGGTISWSSGNAKTVAATANPANASWAGNKTASGNAPSGNLAPERLHSFELSCVNDAGETTDFVDVNVVSGDLSCPAETRTDTTLQIKYSYKNVSSPYLKRGTTILSTFAGGEGGGIFPDKGLSPNTDYLYELWSSASKGPIRLAGISCRTLIYPNLTAETPSVSSKDGAVQGKTNTFYVGSAITLSGNITNKGATSAGASKTAWKGFEATAKTPNPPQRVRDYGTLDPLAETGTLGSGASAMFTRNIEGLRLGTFALGLLADSADAVQETNENDNDSLPLVITVVPRPPASVDLTVTDDTGSNRLQGTGGTLTNQSYGSAHTLRWTSENTTSCTGTNFDADKERNNTAGVGTGGLSQEEHTYTITCDAQPYAVNGQGVVGEKVTDTVTVAVNPPTLSCVPDRASAFVNEPITWAATPNPATPPSGSGAYSYAWTSTGATPSAQTGASLSFPVAYQTSGSYTASATLVAPGSRTAVAACGAPPGTPVVITALPDLIATAPVIEGLTSDDDPLTANTYYPGRATISGTVTNNGDATAPASFTSQYRWALSSVPNFFSVMKDGNNSDLQFALDDASTALVPGTESGRNRFVNTRTWDAGPNTPGESWLFEACADYPPGTVTEKNEGNNCSSATRITILARPTAQLIVEVTGEGGVTTPDKKIDCIAGATIGCSRSFDKGSLVELTANTPDTVKFEGWGGECDIPQLDKKRPTCTLELIKETTTAAAGFTGKGGKGGKGGPSKEPPTVSCAPTQATQYVNKPVVWEALTTPSSGSFSFSWGGSDPLPSAPSAARVSVDYPTTGSKTGTVVVTDTITGLASERTNCAPSSVTIAPEPPCDSNTFSLSATPSIMYASYNDSDVSESSTITVAAGSCFTKTVRFALPKDVKLGGADVTYQGAPTSLAPLQFGTGLQFSVKLKNKNKPVPNGSYFPLQVCADTKSSGAASCDASVNVTLEVTDTPPAGRGSSPSPLPVFEEF